LNEIPIENLPEVIDILSSVLAPELDVPYAFYGHSMGALIAYSLARHFSQYAARKPSHLFVGAFTAPHLGNPLLERFRNQCLTEGFASIPMDGVQEAKIVRRLLLEFVEMLGNQSVAEGFSKLVGCIDCVSNHGIEPPLRALLSDLKIVHSYRHTPAEPITVPITAFHGTEDKVIKLEELQAWRQLTTSHFQCHTLPGDHFFVLKEQDRSLLVGLIEAAIANAQKTTLMH
jgi:surfactin synthase thioesterase subunit